MTEGPATYADVTAVLALKEAATAKSRLALPLPLRQRLAWTMAVDTLRALASVVGEIVVVSDQPALASRLRRVGLQVTITGDGGSTGLNAALRRGADLAGGSTVLACVGDLPALRPASVRRVLQAIQDRSLARSYLADATGVGTTMLAVRGGPLEPRFQGRSAAAHHQSGAVSLTDEILGEGVPDARCDVDTEIDLMVAASRGLGPETAALMVPGSGRLGRFEIVTATTWLGEGTDLVVVSADGRRLRLPRASLPEGMRQPRTGQRLNAVTDGSVVLSAWPA